MASTLQHQNASLYIGDVAPEITEANLFDLFKAVGPVLSIRVCRDAITRRSLGYAYVNFQNPHDAERALETLNYHNLKGKPIRIMWSQRDPGLRKAGTGNVFIKNLVPSIDNQTLYDTFSQFGNILSCKVATDSNHTSRGYGFVHFESQKCADEAIEKVNGMLLKENQVYVGRFVRRSQRISQNNLNFTNVYLKNFKSTLSEAELLAILEETVGPVASLCLKKDKKDRPFAFSDFKAHEDAAKFVKAVEAVAATPASNFDERLVEEKEEKKLFVSRAQKKVERQDELRKRFALEKAKKINEYSGSNLYVKNLDEALTDAALKEAFQKFGDIKSAKVMLDEKDISKGFGFVCFSDVEAANKAIAEMNGHMLGAKPLYVNVAQRKEVRRATLEIQYAARVNRMPNPGVPPTQPNLGYPSMYQPPPYSFPQYPGYPIGQGGRGMLQKWPNQPPGQQGMMPFGAPIQSPMPRMQHQMRGGRMASVQGRGGAGIGGRGAMPIRGGGVAPKPLGTQPVGYAYTKQARNREQQVLPQGGAALAPQPTIPGSSAHEPLTAPALAAMSPEQQKNALGERLFARISESHSDYAAKITGMLLEMDVAETLNLLESPEVLQSKIAEALEVLRAHEDQQLA